MEATDDLFSFIEWDSDSQQWCDIEPLEYLNEQAEIEKQISEEQGCQPKIVKVAKKKSSSVPKPEPWESQRVNEYVTLLSNTKFIRNAQVKENIPPRAYVIVPITDYSAFRCGSKDYKWGTKAVIIQEPQDWCISLADFGACLNTEFGMPKPQ